MPNNLLMQARLSVVPQAHFLLTRTFDVLDPGGDRMGSIEGSSTFLELRDTAGALIASFDRPWVFLFTSVRIVLPGGEVAGSLRQMSVWGRIRFEILDASGSAVGALEPDGFGAHTFSIQDGQGRTLGGLGRRTRFFFKTGDYEITLAEPAERWMLFALAGVIAIDKAVHRRRADGAAAPVGAS